MLVPIFVKHGWIFTIFLSGLLEICNKVIAKNFQHTLLQIFLKMS